LVVVVVVVVVEHGRSLHLEKVVGKLEHSLSHMYSRIT
jgi:hypothetical protein